MPSDHPDAARWCHNNLHTIKRQCDKGCAGTAVNIPGGINLVSPPSHPVTVDDMKRLRPGEFLNDTLVDVQLMILESTLSPSVQARYARLAPNTGSHRGGGLEARAFPPPVSAHQVHSLSLPAEFGRVRGAQLIELRRLQGAGAG